MDNLRLFSTENEYDLAVEDFEYPTVSYIKAIEDVRYMLKPDYSTEYLTFEALESGTFTLTIPTSVTSSYMTSVSYSTDNGATWVTTQVDNTLQTITTPTINAGNRILWKGVGKQLAYNSSSNNYSYFSSTGNFNITGNAMSLLYGDNFANQNEFPSDSTYNLSSLFYNTTSLISAKNLILSATTLADYCYSCMFNGCTSLTTAPKLPATTLANYCYERMYFNCTSLTTAPELPATTMVSGCYWSMFCECSSLTTAPELLATTLAERCYERMFRKCTSLTTATELPTTTLANYCYSSMFYGCTSLTAAPNLPATTLANYCYSSMFSGCTNLNYIKAMFTTTPSYKYTDGWVTNVAASGTFVKNSAAQWDVTGTGGVPSGWTVQTASA